MDLASRHGVFIAGDDFKSGDFIHIGIICLAPSLISRRTKQAKLR